MAEMKISYGSSYEYQSGSGCDRLFVDKDSGVFALFEGEGSNIASETAVDLLDTISSDPLYYHPYVLLDRLSTEVNDDFRVNYSRSSCSATIIKPDFSEYFNNSWSLGYAHAGDSRLYRADSSGSLQLAGQNGSLEAMPENKLGLRSSDSLLINLGSIRLNGLGFFALTSSGVTCSEKASGTDHSKILDILSSDLDPQTKADTLVNESNNQHDKTAIVVEIEV